MIKLFTETQFVLSKGTDLLELECEHCHNHFLKSKKRIFDALNPNQKGKGNGGKFCSKRCASLHLQKRSKFKCKNCQKEVERMPCEIRKSKNLFCSHSCSATFFNAPRKKIVQNTILHFNYPQSPNFCQVCNRPTYNQKYCSGTCRNKINNQNISGSRSKAETVLFAALKQEFPNWEILVNDRKILNGLELDIFIPKLNLAIEWNGIFHYEPIHGEDSLVKIQNKDGLKIQKCKELGIELLIVCDRTSHSKFISETVRDIIDKLKLLAGWKGIAPL